MLNILYRSVLQRRPTGQYRGHLSRLLPNHAP